MVARNNDAVLEIRLISVPTQPRIKVAVLSIGAADGEVSCVNQKVNEGKGPGKGGVPMQAVRVTEMQDAQALRFEVQHLIRLIPICVHEGVSTVWFLVEIEIQLQMSSTQAQMTQIVLQHPHSRRHALPGLYSFPLLKPFKRTILRPFMQIHCTQRLRRSGEN